MFVKFESYNGTKMDSDSLRLLTSSQDNMMMNDVRELGLSDLDQFFDTHEEKFDISQPIPPVPQQQQQQQQQQQEALILPVHLPQAQMLTNEEFPGDFNFQLAPDQQDDDTKSWVYSTKMKKVFIEMEKTLPIRIKWAPQRSGLYITAVMAFCQPTHRSDPVIRCHNHAAGSNQGSRHVLSCKHTDAQYSERNGHHFVRVPLGTPQPGSDAVQMDFMFHCKNSCCTGINRRRTEVVFNLEDEMGLVLGRNKLYVRICSCPKRDREKEENPKRNNPAPKRRKLASGKKFMPTYREQPQHETDSEIFTFSARIYGRENFEYLKHIACSLMALTIERSGQQATIRPLIDDITRMK